MSCFEKRDRMLFQYKSAEKFLTLWDELFDVADQTGACDLYSFFDLENAEGIWLDYLGLIFNQGRELTTFGNIFTYDVDSYDSGAVYDGEKSPLPDSDYRALIWSRIANNATSGTVNEIIGVLTTALNVDNVTIVQGVKDLDITIDFTDSSSLETFNALSAVKKNWFGVPAGVSFTVTKVL